MPAFNTPTPNEKLQFVTLKLSKDLSTDPDSFGLFDQREFCDEFIKILIHYIEHHELNLYGFVILSNQIHLIAASTNGELTEKIEGLKNMNAKIMIRLLSQKLSSSNNIKSKDHQEVRRFFSQFLNSKNDSFWENNELYTELKFNENQSNLNHLTSQQLLVHLAESDRNYLQLGASAFTKLMMESMNI